MWWCCRRPGTVLIKAVSIGVNPSELYVGGYPGFTPYHPKEFPKVDAWPGLPAGPAVPNLPSTVALPQTSRAVAEDGFLVLGGDVAGIVEEADEGSKASGGNLLARFKKGDKVFALTPGYYNETPEGCYAEYVVAEEGWVARVPDNLPLDEAAGVPLVALTAWQALNQVPPQAGQRALITAASGGVGHIAVQLAKALGLTVVGVAGTKNLDWVKSLGADEVVDYTQQLGYTTQDVAEVYKDNPFDLAVDSMGTRSDLLSKTLSVLKPSGHYACIMNTDTDPALLEAARKEHEAGKGPSVGTTLVQPNGEQLQQVADLIAAGKVKLTVAQKIPLEEFGKAHDQIATGHTRGKVVLTV
ncbi:hypothetical protein N2152v2_009732 [Parachlorella kessleri]